MIVVVVVIIIHHHRKYGLCKVVTSDQGTEFNNAINQELMKLLKIDYRLTTPYHVHNPLMIVKRVNGVHLKKYCMPPDVS